MNIEKEPADVAVQLLAELHAARSVGQFVSLLNRLDQRKGDLETETAAGIAREALGQLAELTESTPEVAGQIMVTHLLPWCAMRRDSGRTSFAGHEFRELLKDWIYGFPQNQIGPLREFVLNDVCKRLRTEPTKELLWVVAAIGYRSDEVTDIVRPILFQRGDLSDLALGVFAGLGANLEDRDVLLDCVQDKLATGEETRGMIIAIQELVGPHRIELATEFLRRAAEKSFAAEYSHDFALTVSTVTTAVNRCPADMAAHNQIWGILRHHFKTVRATDKYASSCNTNAVVPDCVQWLLNDEVDGNREIGDYSLMSHLGKLTKPEQLAGWDEVSSSELADFLRSVAISDSKMKGQYATTVSRLKKETWETALTLGKSNVIGWIDAAIMNESNPYVAHDVADIVACLQIDEPPRRLLAAIVSSEKVDDDNGHFFRQTGFIEIARSSGSRQAFESLLHFQLTQGDAVLLSTIDAITDVSVSRIDAGDTDVVEKVLEMTSPSVPKHNRDAAVSVFSKLSKKRLVAKTQSERLRDFVTRDDIHEYSRRETMEAIGFFESLDSEKWSDWVRRIARSDNDEELRFRACESLIRQGWLIAEDEVWLFKHLGLAENEFGIRVEGTVNGWQAFLIGLLFQGDRIRFCGPVSTIIAECQTDVVYQVLNSLRFLGTACPTAIADTLARRILTTNNKASADTEFFRVLGEVAPSKTLSLAKAANWSGWLVEARVALCESIWNVGRNDESIYPEAKECLQQFMQDAAFPVRRSACRALADLDMSALETVCRIWQQSTDVDLRKRAAEAMEWFPADSYPDEMIEEFGFGWDAERSVREIWKTVLLNRRQRGWANQYTARLVSACGAGNHSVLTEYRYGRALARIGDDACITRLEELLATDALCPNVKHWLEKIAKETRQNWRKVTEAWPQPWSTEKGTIEELDAEILIQDGGPHPVRLFLWCHHRSGPSDLCEWGGVAKFVDGRSRFGLALATQLEIRIAGRSPAFATVFGYHFGSHANAQLTFGGKSPYPTATHAERLEGDGSLAEIVAHILQNLQLKLTATGDDDARQRFQAVLERTSLSFEFNLESGTAAKTKIVCQETALVTRAMADLLPAGSDSASALARVASIMFAREGLTLELSADEVEEFATVARSGDADSPDELLFWLMDRVVTTRKSDKTRRRLTI